MTYKKAGVNIKRADVFVRGIKKVVYRDPLQKLGAFGSLFDFSRLHRRYKSPVFVSSADGVGTKLLLAQELGRHNTVGVDLVAMNVNDIICMGAKPLFFLDYIACGSLNPRVLKPVVTGIGRALRDSGCALLGGETAEMPGMYKKDEYDLAGFCVGLTDRDKLIDGRTIKPGDCVIGLSSSGPHSNGYSLIRRVLGRQGVKKHAKVLLEPTRIYVECVSDIIARYRIRGIAHVTGGAFYDKVTKIVPSGLGMVINKRAWPHPEIFKIIQQRGGISDREMYTVFNMGIGMILVVSSTQAASVLRRVRKFYPAYVIGAVTKSKKRMIVK